MRGVLPRNIQDYTEHEQEQPDCILILTNRYFFPSMGSSTYTRTHRTRTTHCFINAARLHSHFDQSLFLPLGSSSTSSCVIHVRGVLPRNIKDSIKHEQPDCILILTNRYFFPWVPRPYKSPHRTPTTHCFINAARLYSHFDKSLFLPIASSNYIRPPREHEQSTPFFLHATDCIGFIY
jgi:hypothetical protein